MSVPQSLQQPDLLQQLAACLGQQVAQPQHNLLEFPNQKSKQQLPQSQQSGQPLSQLQGMGQARAVHIRPTDYSRYCQVDYSEKVKAENANLVMFCYGYIAQILASRQGHIAQMSDTEVNGILQHLLHLLELTAMFSSNTEYSSFAWHRARNYNSRIFSDLDHGNTTWSSISSKMDPTNLMQAIEAIPKEVKKKDREEEKKKKSEDGPPCPKWNTCDVQGKCSYEVDNPGRTCNRPHICSYCYSRFGYTRTNQSVRRKKKQIPHYLLALVWERALSPPDKGSQASPRPVTSTLDVAQILPTIDFCELDIIHKPAQPEIKVSELKDAFFFLPNNRIFIDKALPESEPIFLNKIYQNQPFSPSFFVDLYQRVNRPGPSYPRGTYNFKGARISLMHTSLNIPVWRQYLADYFRKDLVEYLEFGFPIGVDPEGHTEPCLKNHSSSYMFFSYLDKFCIKEIINGGLSGPFSSVPFETFQLSPMMTAPKKPSGRRPVFDASYGSSLNDITPQDYYLEWQAEYDFPKLDSLETLILAIGPGALMWKRDLSRYFLQLPLDPVDYWRTGFV